MLNISCIGQLHELQLMHGSSFDLGLLSALMGCFLSCSHQLPWGTGLFESNMAAQYFLGRAVDLVSEESADSCDFRSNQAGLMGPKIITYIKFSISVNFSQFYFRVGIGTCQSKYSSLCNLFGNMISL